MDKCIVCDWLQLHVTLPFVAFDTEYIRGYELLSEKKGYQIKPKYDVVKKDYGTQQFKDLYYIHHPETGEEIAVLAAHPRSEQMLKSDSGILKIINKQLYQANLRGFVEDFLKEFGLVFVNITRIDVAVDFLQFDTMRCEDFIQSYMECTYLKAYKTKHFAIGSSWSVERGKLTGGHEGLKFGKATSDVTYMLYNKTLELSEKENKPWISENWRANGYDATAPVWRLEFQLHSDTRGIVIDDDTVIFFNDLAMIENIAAVWLHCYNKHFQFVHTEVTRAGNFRKQSRCRKLELFTDFTLKPIVIKPSPRKSANRSHKVFIKALHTLNNELRGKSWDMCIAGNKLMTLVVKQRNLEDWFEKKFPTARYDADILEYWERGLNANFLTEFNTIITDKVDTTIQPKVKRNIYGSEWTEAPF